MSSLLILSAVVLIELILLYLLSRQIMSLLYLFVYVPTKHTTISRHFISFLFLPGTILHEFSHAVMAKLLGVPIGEIKLYPHKDPLTQEFKAGSIEIAKKDPFRLSLIGIAPTIIGITLITLTVLYLYNFSLPTLSFKGILEPLNNPKTLLIILILFMISSTMFTSKADIREFVIIAPLGILIIGIIYWLGLRISITSNAQSYLQILLYKVTFSLAFTITIDIILFTFIYTPVLLITRLLKLRSNL